MAATELSPTQKELAITLWETGAFKLGRFNRLKYQTCFPDAPDSPYKITIRRKDMIGCSWAERLGNFELMVTVAAESLLKVTEEIRREKLVDCFIGLPKVGEQIGLMFLPQSNLEMIRAFKTGEGVDRHISKVNLRIGPPQRHILTLDDVLTTAQTNTELDEMLVFLNQSIKYAAVCIDREQGGKERLERRGIRVISVATASQLFGFYLESNRIDQSVYNQYLEYRGRFEPFRKQIISSLEVKGYS